MWVEETKNGKYKFVERYEDYLTGQTKKVSVTMEKNTSQTRKIAQKALDEKINKVMSKNKEKATTIKELIEEYRQDQKRTVKKSTYTRNYHACNTIMSILGENTIVERMTAKYIHDRFLATGKAPGTLNEHLARFRALMLMYGKEASNRKQEIDRQHHTIPNQRNQRPKDKHRGNVYNLLFRHGKVHSQNMEKLKGSFPTFCKQTFPQLHKTASYAHYTQCRLLRNPSLSPHRLFLLWHIPTCVNRINKLDYFFLWGRKIILNPK